ncbi:translation factor [Haematococcus lacustris]
MHRTTLQGVHSRSWLGHSDVRVAASPRNVKRLKYAEFGQAGSLKIDDPAIISLKGDGSDLWRLDSVVDHLKRGGVGIIPTDTLPALVVDLENKDAVMKLYRAKELDPKKPLSILCKSFQEVAYYTLGFPAANTPGQQNWFPVFKRVLPGPYTIILPASKNLPGQCVDFMKGKTIHRKSVGIRMPDDAVCKAVLEGLGRPLLCTSVHVTDVLAPDTEVPDSGSMYEAYAGKGIDFIVDIGRRVATQSTVVDMTGAEPVVTRLGRGDPSPFQ